ncbi:MAG: hypothetical protein ACM3X5_00040, partial [Bacillota bacterium]
MVSDHQAHRGGGARRDLMFVILTSKPGQFHTEAGKGIEAVERYEYAFCGHVKATFVIATLEGAARVRIVDE